MTIDKKREGTSLLVSLNGRLDTITAPSLEKELQEDLKGLTQICFDFSELQYVSSAGLRVLLICQKQMNATKGKMKIWNVKDIIMDVFEATGFVDILTIE